MAVYAFDLTQGYGVFFKGDYETAPHAHYGIEVVRCRKGAFSVTTDRMNHVNIQSIIIPPNVHHSFNCRGAECELLFLDPLSDVGSYFMHAYRLDPHKGVIVNSSELSQHQKNGKFDISTMLEKSRGSRRHKRDARISRCLETINSQLTNENITLLQLSRAAFLSESRLSHLFKEQLGISVRQCILWKKIMVAISKRCQGYTLTECAHHAGFSDSSHFNKVFSQMFGINPYFALRR